MISVAEPLLLVIHSPVDSLSANSFGMALQGHLTLLRSRGFHSTRVNVDPQRGLKALKGHFPGVLIEDCGAGDHLPKVDIRIRRVKEIVRGVFSALPYQPLVFC